MDRVEHNVKITRPYASATQNTPRRLWFLYLLVSISVVGFFGCLIGVPLLLLGRLSRQMERMAGRYAQWAIHKMLKTNLWMDFSFDVGTLFTDPRLRSGAVLVSNHRSHLDVFLLISYIPSIRVISKLRFYAIPFLGFMMWAMRMIPTQSGNPGYNYKAMQRSIKHIKERQDFVHFFPEGSRAQADFLGVQPFSWSAFWVAKQCNAMVVPIVFYNTDEAWPKGVAKIRYGVHVRAKVLTPLDPSAYLDARSMAAATADIIEQELLRGRT